MINQGDKQSINEGELADMLPVEIIDATVNICDSKTVTQEQAYWLLPVTRREMCYREVGVTGLDTNGSRRVRGS